jgi:hypothetical protein
VSEGLNVIIDSAIQYRSLRMWHASHEVQRLLCQYTGCDEAGWPLRDDPERER